MAQPKISWTNPASSDSVYVSDTKSYSDSDATSYLNFNTIDAGSNSVSQVRIWNNKEATASISDAVNCTLSVLQNAGNPSTQLLDNSWVSIQMANVSGDAYTAFASATTKVIKADDATIGTGTIQGSGTGSKQYSTLNVKVAPLAGATSGVYNFTTRLTYQYV